MEPVLGGRDDQAYYAARDLHAIAPQWSPSLADGTTGLRLPAAVDRDRAAMEPVLGGRDDRARAAAGPLS